MQRRAEDDALPAAARGGGPASGPGAAAPRGGLLPAAAAAGAAGAAVWVLWWLHTASLPPGQPAGSAWLAALALLLAVAGAAWTGHLLARTQAAALLHDARAQAQALAQSLDAWQWHTDAQHRLVRWQPPQGAPGSAWAASAAGPAALLWERFADADGALRARAQALAPIEQQAVKAGANGTTQWLLRGAPRFDARGRFTGYSGLARPLDAELARRADADALDALLRSLPVALWLLQRQPDGRGWAVRRANAAAARHVPQPEGRPWDDVLAALPAPLREAVGRLGDGGQVMVEDGMGVAVERVDDDARLVALVPRADESAQRASAEHASFSYTVTHDLRAPLRVVEGFTRIVQEDYGRVLDRVGNDHLTRVLAAAARMHSMIDAMLALAQLSAQPLAHQPVDLSQLASFVVDELARQSPGRKVDVHIEPGMAVRGDPTLLRIALENLLGNAWKYTAKTAAPQVAFESRVQDGRRVFVVRDNGAGFDMRFADRLFGAFQRLHSANDYAGTGVGLASVRRIVRRHGGDVWAEAEVGQGARFYFTLGGG
jgi:signal transduction histidine kinase